MNTHQIEIVLLRLMQGGDVTPADRSDNRARIENLRCFGHLPPGDGLSQHLNAEQIARAVLGLAPVRADWAGHAAAVLGGLRPKGGAAEGFCGAPNLVTAIALLIMDCSARQMLDHVRISMGQAGDYRGYAQIALEHQTFSYSWAYPGDVPRPTDDPDATACAQLASRELVLAGRFFDELASAITLRAII